MALIKCPECGGELSDVASTCPHCGRPITKPKKKLDVLGLVFTLFLIGFGIWTWWSFRPASLLIGTWQSNNNSKNIIEVFPNGTFSMSNSPNGSYQFLDNDRVRVDMGGIGAIVGPIIVTYDVSDDTLVLKYNNSEETLQRTSRPAFPVFLFSFAKNLFTKSKTISF